MLFGMGNMTCAKDHRQNRKYACQHQHTVGGGMDMGILLKNHRCTQRNGTELQGKVGHNGNHGKDGDQCSQTATFSVAGRDKVGNRGNGVVLTNTA